MRWSRILCLLVFGFAVGCGGSPPAPQPLTEAEIAEQDALLDEEESRYQESEN